jgi:hypothetical protein
MIARHDQCVTGTGTAQSTHRGWNVAGLLDAPHVFVRGVHSDVYEPLYVQRQLSALLVA